MFFFPLFDENATSRRPIIVWITIAICIIVFVWQQSLDELAARIAIFQFGFVPAIVLQGESLPSEFSLLPGWATIITSMFLHGGWLHLGGNIIYLWIFGDNVESILGHARYFSFYIFCGIGAALGQFFIEPTSTTPMVGASGAIAGVLGAYMIKFPKAKVHVFAVIIIFITTFIVPAQIVLGIWFIMQLSGGLNSLGINTTGGVAWFAHIGGFLVGVGSLKIFQTFHFEHNE